MRWMPEISNTPDVTKTFPNAQMEYNKWATESQKRRILRKILYIQSMLNSDKHPNYTKSDHEEKHGNVTKIVSTFCGNNH